MIGIIDYGMGNLRSVQKAFESLGCDARILTRPPEAREVDRLVLPGVGAFADGMANLNQLGWTQALTDFIHAGKPLLGICLGMQLLFESSEEGAPSPGQPIPGLGLLPGKVVGFTTPAPDGQRIKIPHMGWNQIHWSRKDPLLDSLNTGCEVYFVHGYYVVPGEDALVTAHCHYGQRFAATVWRQNIWAVQFHPEKSQRVGLAMLHAFATCCPTACTTG